MDQLPTAEQLAAWLEEAHAVHAHIFGDNGNRLLTDDQYEFYRKWSDRIESVIGRPEVVALLASVTVAYSSSQRSSRRLICRAINIFGHHSAGRAETEFCDSLAADVGEKNLAVARYDESQTAWSERTKSLFCVMNAKQDWKVDLRNAVDAMVSQAGTAL